MPTHSPTPAPAPTPEPIPWVTRRVRVSLFALLCVLLALTGITSPARAETTVSPRNFKGYGFDQCLTPTQSAMDAWLRSSPFWAVGIYISGKSRACRNQPNQTPTWVKTQLANGWRLLPITLGPQASCNPRFPRYNDDVRINPSSSRSYLAARKQGRAEAATAVARAQELGIGEGSTLWYDMEAYDSGNTACRESALSFMSAWTNRLHELKYVSGVYSSAASGIADLDNARVNRPDRFTMPDRIWIARWDMKANTSTSYIRDDGWLPGNRMKQYHGGHNETWGGVTINIDSNWLDLGRGSTALAEKEHCGGVVLNFKSYPDLREGATGDFVKAVQCLLQRSEDYTGKITGTLDKRTMDAVVAFRTAHGLDSRRLVGAGAWTAMHADGNNKLIKFGASGERVRRLQRALNAAGEDLTVDGSFAAATNAAVKRYQRDHGLAQSGVVTPTMWSKLTAGKF